MRHIFNIGLVFLIFFLGHYLFPDKIVAVDNKSLFTAAIFMILMYFAVELLMVFSVFLIPVGIGILTTLILVVIAIFLTPVRLLILDHYLTGFSIHGFWTYLILTAVLSVFVTERK